MRLNGPVPDHLREWWEPSMSCLHSAAWRRNHWKRSGSVAVELVENMSQGWQVWLDWQRVICPDNATEINALEADAGRYLGYVRIVGSRPGGASWMNRLSRFHSSTPKHHF